jgi:hypothetical protein
MFVQGGKEGRLSSGALDGPDGCGTELTTVLLNTSLEIVLSILRQRKDVP